MSLDFILGLISGAISMIILAPIKIITKYSCAPTAGDKIHTFSTDEQWSCDCGQVRKENFLSKNSKR